LASSISVSSELKVDPGVGTAAFSWESIGRGVEMTASTVVMPMASTATAWPVTQCQ
jgi:hypothetical protein